MSSEQNHIEQYSVLDNSITGEYPLQNHDEGEVLADLISGHKFTSWYREREFAQNIRNGTPFFNGPPTEQPPEKHSPSKLLRCQRKTYYQYYNAPKETSGPKGIYWFGSQFEREVAVPFLRSLVGDGQYVRNSIWIDVEIPLDDELIRVRGETDPVIVDRESNPILLTEIKTTSSVEYLEQPKTHHKAQVHAYLRGLAEKYETAPKCAVILYADRESFDVTTFTVGFDPMFWDDVTGWAARQTNYRKNKELPPAEPEEDWECQYCPYESRCGKDDAPVEDAPPKGIVPNTRYPQSALKTYLDGHKTAKLTPSLATKYPELADAYPVYDWHCECCDTAVPFTAIDWDGNVDSLPQCPSCKADGRPAELHDPPLANQWPRWRPEHVQENEGGSA